MFRTRRELEAKLFITKAARRRAAPHRDPSLIELIIGLSAFVILVMACLYAVAWLGR
ncbi:hypothetical protein [uncultured Enterovirga sp.]|uniref:hypothetical protein n=1 Tax=uncultured Enterovirga sp. TaxID=2026352 RepID=UPI0035CA9E62